MAGKGQDPGQSVVNREDMAGKTQNRLILNRPIQSHHAPPDRHIIVTEETKTMMLGGVNVVLPLLAGPVPINQVSAGPVPINQIPAEPDFLSPNEQQIATEVAEVELPATREEGQEGAPGIPELLKLSSSALTRLLIHKIIFLQAHRQQQAG
jgi:hypothetical protein